MSRSFEIHESALFSIGAKKHQVAPSIDFHEELLQYSNMRLSIIYIRGINQNHQHSQIILTTNKYI